MSRVECTLNLISSRRGKSILPFAGVASDDLPLSRLLRLSLLEVSLGISLTLLVGSIASATTFGAFLVDFMRVAAAGRHAPVLASSRTRAVGRVRRSGH